jgi:hypothetical protein
MDALALTHTSESAYDDVNVLGRDMEPNTTIRTEIKALKGERKLEV